jgi:hypothetical protein
MEPRHSGGYRIGGVHDLARLVRDPVAGRLRDEARVKLSTSSEVAMALAEFCTKTSSEGMFSPVVYRPRKPSTVNRVCTTI